MTEQMDIPDEREQLDFLTYIQRLLREGGFVSTYKYALLLALTRISVEEGNGSGAPLRITSQQIAEKFISYYWDQARPYTPGGGVSQRVLLQNTDRQAGVVRAIEAVRRRFDGSLSKLNRDDAEWRKLVREVAGIVKDMPLWKLQTLGRQIDERLYPNTKGADGIELKPGIAFCFRRFHGLVVDLVEGAWIRFVRNLPANQETLGQVGADLSEFLFGSDRADLSSYKPLLREIQSGECFYCQGALRGSSGEVDHFIPWVRYPVDLGHNFVLADAECNNNKRDWIAAAEHLARWCERNHQHAGYLAAEFDRENRPHDVSASRQITRWAYEQVEMSESKVWQKKKDVLIPLDPGWRRHLEMDPPAP